MAKVMISVPDELLAQIDREAKRRGTSRSGFLQEAAGRELGRPDRTRFDELLADARAALRETGGFESAEVIRAQRDARDTLDRARM